MSRRVVITGLGAVTCLGTGFYPTWEGLVAGRSGLGRLTRVSPEAFACRLGGEAKGFSVREFVPKGYRKATKVMARDTELAVAAAELAARDAKLATRQAGENTGACTYASERIGCHVGAGLIAAETEELAVALASAKGADGAFSLRAWGTEGGEGSGAAGGMNDLQPLWMLKYLPNMPACHVSIIHGTEGPSNTLTCAEASGLLSLGESVRVIQRGAAECCFAGGAESKLSHMGILHLTLAGRLAETGEAEDGAGVVRPFDAGSPGTVPGEAGGILVIEELGSAARRGAGVYAEVAGFGAGQSGPPNIPPLPVPGAGAVNEGLALAISRALRDAGVGAAEVDAIVPQGAGVPAIDIPEAGALRRVFGERLAAIPLVTHAPMLGDCLAGNGGVQAAIGAMCVREQRLPARVNAGRPMPGLDAGAAASRAARLRHVLVCSGSLGGQNAAVVLRAVAS